MHAELLLVQVQPLATLQPFQELLFLSQGSILPEDPLLLQRPIQSEVFNNLGKLYFELETGKNAEAPQIGELADRFRNSSKLVSQ